MSKIYKSHTEIHCYKLEAIQSPLVGTGTFQSNSPVGSGRVHDIHASNIDLNAQARAEMLSNPVMWMFNSPNQQDFWKDFVDKRVQEALNPTLLRSAATSATFISNTTTFIPIITLEL
jgi:hypothetical protein